MKHTKGPWENQWENEQSIAVGMDDTWKEIAWIRNCINHDGNPLMSWEESEANARLIAESPNMLKAIKEILDRLIDPENPSRQQWLCSDALHPFKDNGETIVDYLKEVYKKATGEKIEP